MQEIKEYVYEQYGKELNICPLYGSKSLNKLFFAQDEKEQYIIKILVNSPCKVDTIVALQYELSKLGLAPQLIKNRFGKFACFFNGSGLYMQEYIEHIKDYDESVINISEMIVFLKRVYDVYDNIEIVADNNNEQNVIEVKKNIMLEEYIKFKKELIGSLEIMSQYEFSKKNIHGDLRPLNILYNGQRFWIIDFDYSRIGDRQKEIYKLILLLKPRSIDILKSIYLEFVDNNMLNFDLCKINDSFLQDLLRSNFPEKVSGKIDELYLQNIIKERTYLIKKCLEVREDIESGF